MRTLLLAGAFSLLGLSQAFAAEDGAACEINSTRAAGERAAAPDEPARQPRKGARELRDAVNNNALQPAAPRPDARSSGGGGIRRIPDAMLIDGRGAL